MKKNNFINAVTTVKNPEGELQNVCIIMPYCESVVKIIKRIEHMFNIEVINIQIFVAEYMIHLGDEWKEI